MQSQMHTKIVISAGQDFKLWKIYFFKLFLDGLSDFLQNQLETSANNTGKSFMINQTVLEKCINEFDKICTKVHMRLYLRNALWDSDQTWYMHLFIISEQFDQKS